MILHQHHTHFENITRMNFLVLIFTIQSQFTVFGELLELDAAKEFTDN